MPTEAAQAARDKHRGLMARKRELEEQLDTAEAAQRRELRRALAAVEEDLVASNRLLRELMPRHKISVPTQGDKVWQRDVEAAVAAEGKPDREALTRQVTELAMERVCTPAQRETLLLRQEVRTDTEAARVLGVGKSCVGRRLKRGRRELRAIVEPALVLREAAAAEGRIDLHDGRQLRAYLELLTPQQQMCISLYYGEWLTVREIGALLGRHPSAVLRAIQRGLARLTICLDDDTRVEGMDRLEDLLVAHYSAADLQAEAPKGESGKPWSGRMHERRPYNLWHMRVGHLRLYVTGGRLRQWLMERHQEAAETQGARALWRALAAAFARIRDLIRGG